MSSYIIGDVHGHFNELSKVLNKVDFNPQKDTLYSVGDFCDRGPQNTEVLSLLMSLKDSFKSVFGNHDIWIWQYLHKPSKEGFKYMLRDAEQTWLYNGGGTTRSQISELPSSKKKEIFNFLRILPHTIEYNNIIITHTPAMYIREGLVLKDTDLTKLTLEETMNKQYCAPDYDSWFWDRSLFIDYGSYLPMLSTPKISPKDFRAKTNNRLVICGHTPVNFRPLYLEDYNILNIDTGAAGISDGSGAITILNLDTFEYYQSNGGYGNLSIQE